MKKHPNETRVWGMITIPLLTFALATVLGCRHQYDRSTWLRGDLANWEFLDVKGAELSDAGRVDDRVVFVILVDDDIDPDRFKPGRESRRKFGISHSDSGSLYGAFQIWRWDGEYKDSHDVTFLEFSIIHKKGRGTAVINENQYSLSKGNIFLVNAKREIVQIPIVFFGNFTDIKNSDWLAELFNTYSQ